MVVVWHLSVIELLALPAMARYKPKTKAVQSEIAPRSLAVARRLKSKSNPKRESFVNPLPQQSWSDSGAAPSRSL